MTQNKKKIAIKRMRIKFERLKKYNSDEIDTSIL